MATEKTKQQVVDRLKQANNVLVTVRRDPSVDQLAACIGLSLVLNKLEKHATAVYSGVTPSTIEFLKPEDTLEKNTDSLRDFIISLDKSKADKLRYKVEDQVVRIFITPYRASISDADLDFSQGDFNVDVVLALGVQEQRDLDQAITTHGRILHDATVITLNNDGAAELGAINWTETQASSLSELAAGLATALGKDTLDEQIATAFLTGVVAETERFSNEKTSAETMKVSSTLMAAGANQQLVATKLEESVQPSAEAQDTAEAADDTNQDTSADETLEDAHINEDGTLEINHERTASLVAETPDQAKDENANDTSPTAADETTEDAAPAENSQDAPAEEPRDDQPQSPSPDDTPAVAPSVAYKNPRKIISEPLSTTNAQGAGLDGEHEQQTDPLTLPTVEDRPATNQPVFNASMPEPAPVAPTLPPSAPPQTSPAPEVKQTLEDIEQRVQSPHLDGQAAKITAHDELNLADLKPPADLVGVDAARDAVAAAMAEIAPSDASNVAPPKVQALNAQPLGGPLHPSAAPNAPFPASSTPAASPLIPNQPPAGPAQTAATAEQPVTMPLPTQAPAPTAPQGQTPTNPNAPPPVPPPIMPFPQ